MILSKKKKYLQIALNSTPQNAQEIISKLPVSDRILIEAGTPLIKQFGMGVISQLYSLWGANINAHRESFTPYIVADLKTMDRAEREVYDARNAGASAGVVLGQAPLETIESFIEECKKVNMDSMVDMIGVEHPISILRQMKNKPDIVVLHRGVDEEKFNKNKPIPYVQIHKIRSSYSMLISMAGGDTVREVQRAIFNDANIVVVWKEFYSANNNVGNLATEFLKCIK